MSEWRRGTIGEFAKGHRGVTYAAGQLLGDHTADSVILLRSNNIRAGRLNFDDIQIVPEHLVAEQQLMRESDIAVCMSNGSKSLVGKAAALSDVPSGRVTVGAFCSLFRPEVDCIPEFVSQLFQSNEYRKNLDLALAGSAINNLRNRDVEAFSCDIPPVREQRTIAEIVDTLDAAIHETEALIAKLKAVKQGLLHDLLTRGIDANGELRPPQSKAPHLYKSSQLGWIPNGWVVDSAGSILAGIDAGWSPSCPEEPPREGEWGVLKVSAVSGGSYDARQSKRLPPNLRPIFSIEVRVGDVLLARANGVADLVAKTVLVRDTPAKLMLSDKILRLVPNEKLVSAEYLMRLMMHAGTRSQINGMMNGSSGQRNISQSQIRSIIVPIPPLIEQAMGMERLNELVCRMEDELKILQKQKYLKHALMDDLLTGRVRVTPLLDAATA